MVRYAKLFEVIFKGRFWQADKWELNYLDNSLKRAVPASDEDAKDIISTAKESFAGKISKHFLDKIIVIGKAKQSYSLIYFVLFPVSVWTQKKSDINTYTAGSIEKDEHVPGRTAIVSGATGEIRVADAKRSQ